MQVPTENKSPIINYTVTNRDLPIQKSAVIDFKIEKLPITCGQYLNSPQSTLF